MVYGRIVFRTTPHVTSSVQQSRLHDEIMHACTLCPRRSRRHFRRRLSCLGNARPDFLTKMTETRRAMLRYRFGQNYIPGVIEGGLMLKLDNFSWKACTYYGSNTSKY